MGTQKRKEKRQGTRQGGAGVALLPFGWHEQPQKWSHSTQKGHISVQKWSHILTQKWSQKYVKKTIWSEGVSGTTLLYVKHYLRYSTRSATRHGAMLYYPLAASASLNAELYLYLLSTYTYLPKPLERQVTLYLSISLYINIARGTYTYRRCM